MKKRTVSGLMFLLLITCALTLAFNIKPTLASEPPPTEWSRTYGGEDKDEAVSVAQTPDGGYVLAGWSNSLGAGGYDFWIVKTDWTGNPQWNTTFGGVDDDLASDIIFTNDGGYAITGRTDSFGAGEPGEPDGWLIKTDFAGNHLWNRTIGGNKNDELKSVIQTVDGGYALAGTTHSYGAGKSDAWLIKTNSSGHLEWDVPFGGGGYDRVDSVVQTIDGKYAFAGRTVSYGAGNEDVFLIVTNSTGNIEWTETYGGVGNDAAHSLVQTYEGGYALAGYTWSFGAGGRDCWLVKTDDNGVVQWNRTYGGTSNEWIFGGSVVQTGDGGYALAGGTESFGAGGWDFWLIKLAPAEIPATIDIDPNTLNLKSNGVWITAYIELPESYHVEDIDTSTVMLNNTISVDPDGPTQIGDYDLDGVADLMVKFDRASIIERLGSIDYSEDTGKSYLVTFTITGKVLDMIFEGSDTIKVLRK